METVAIDIETKIPRTDAMNFDNGWTNNNINTASRFPVCTKSWAPNFSDVISDATNSVQGQALAKASPKLNETQSKYKTSPDKFIGLMRPRGEALRHPAVDNLMQYARTGCSDDCGQQ